MPIGRANFNDQFDRDFTKVEGLIGNFHSNIAKQQKRMGCLMAVWFGFIIMVILALVGCAVALTYHYCTK